MNREDFNNVIQQLNERNRAKEFFSNPVLNDVLIIRYSPIREIAPFININDNFRLIMSVGNKSWTININNFNRIINDLLSDTVEIDELFGSDSEIVVAVNNLGAEIKFEWLQKGTHRPNGGYFNYYHNLQKIDLTRYGIYKNYYETNKYEKNCLEIALLNSGITETEFNKAKSLITTRYVPLKDIKVIADKLDIIIKVKQDNEHNKAYGKNTPYKTKKLVKIGLINDHYFLIENTNYTSYSIKNYFEVNQKEDYNKLYAKNKRSDERFIDSYKLIRLLLENKKTHLTKIDMKNCGTFSTYHNKLFDYENLPEINKDEAKQCEPRELKPPKIFKEEDFDIIYFDTETTTDEEIHKVFLICSEKRGSEEKKVFRGENCVKNWLMSLEKNAICIAHNLRYDFQFIIPHLSRIGNLIKTGNKIKSVDGIFHKNEKEMIKLVFKDSYGLISKPLRDFGKCFNLDVKKEIMPYEVYNKDTINKELIPIKMVEEYFNKELEYMKSNKDKYYNFKKHLKNKEKECKENYEEFIKNVEEWKLFNEDKTMFKHIIYSIKYCLLDVNVLKKGFEKFREQMMEVTNLDIDYALSIPQIANIYGLNKGVFKDCYEISGVPRDFIQRCIVGGRTMTCRNEKIKVKHEVDDFDGVSLYPSAMKRIPGFLKGLPKVWNESIDISKVDGYFLEIEIEKVNKKRNFPLISILDEERGVRNFTNDVEGKKVYIDKFALEDAIRFQKIEYKIIRGYYFDEGRNKNIKEFIEYLFNERLKKKKEKNPIQEIYKLIMNAFYGKTIQKPIEHDYSFVSKKDFDKRLAYRFNTIHSYVKIGERFYLVKEHKTIIDHYSMPHIGVEILSMSKRIMNEVMCLAEDKGIEIYYQDTDSMQIDRRKIYKGMIGVEYLAKCFKEEYSTELIGKNLGQFHCDFELEGDILGDVHAIEAIYLGKKSYNCKLLGKDKEGNEIIGNHCRMKGIPNKCLVEEGYKYENEIIDLYENLYLGKEESFDLLNTVKFKSNNNFTTTNHNEFIRKLYFK